MLNREKINVLRLSQHCSAPKKNTERTKKNVNLQPKSSLLYFINRKGFT